MKWVWLGLIEATAIALGLLVLWTMVQSLWFAVFVVLAVIGVALLWMWSLGWEGHEHEDDRADFHGVL